MCIVLILSSVGELVSWTLLLRGPFNSKMQDPKGNKGNFHFHLNVGCYQLGRELSFSV